ncbi:MAG: hypothetical protein AAF086_05335, partial [Planctomycetota bacterium]
MPKVIAYRLQRRVVILDIASGAQPKLRVVTTAFSRNSDIFIDAADEMTRFMWFESDIGMLYRTNHFDALTSTPYGVIVP